MPDVHRPEMLATGFRALAEVGAELLGQKRVDEIVRSLGLTPEELEDPNAWFSLRSAEHLLEQLERESGDPQFVAKVGRLILSPKHLGPIYPLVRAFGTPAFTYTQMASIARRVNRVGHFDVTSHGPGAITLTYRAVEGATTERGTFLCRARTAQFEALPMLFDLPAASVRHEQCMQRGDAACVYEIQWEEHPKRIVSLSCALSGAFGGVGLSWLWGLAVGPALATCAGMALGAWGLGRVWELKGELGARIADLQDHRDALTTSAESNERRFNELLEAKAALDRKVEERTKELKETSRQLAETLDRLQALDRAKTEQARLRGRPGDLNQVFMNLLDNAVREVGVQGAIRVSGALHDGSYVTVVEDSGTGLEPDHARRIFEPFWTTRRPGEGSGLGLSVALEVVQSHGGTIDVGRSELGGAAFTVRLPFATSGAEAAKAPSPAQPAEAQE